MEKKESLKKNNNIVPKISGLSNKTFGIIKFILGICLLPFVYSSSASFLNGFVLIDKPLQNYFWWGVITILIIYLIIWEPAILYIKGQRLVEIIFSFIRPLVKVAPYLLPVYTIILFILYGLLSFVFSAGGESAFGGKSGGLLKNFVFLFGFSIALHIIFSAKTMRSKQGDFLKANYTFGFSLIYIINLALLAFGFNLIFKEFSFVSFINQTFQTAKDIFYAVSKQLFLR